MSAKFGIERLGIGLLGVCLAGCASRGGLSVIRVEGSDTMVNLAQAWAEQYRQIRPDISVQVLGGGSGVGIASLIDGNCDVANSSRQMQPQEIEKFQARHGSPPREFIVGYDALAVYVHRDNPLEAISLQQLAEIFGEGGRITHWWQLGVNQDPRFGRIVRVNRQNSSGTYSYFREAVLYQRDPQGKLIRRDYGLGSIDQSGSKDVIRLISRTPGAIGYSGMGYQAPGVKMLRISRGPGQPAIAPTAASARTPDPSQRYPITRPLLMYTVGEPEGPVMDYVGWILSPEGQKVVEALGYVPRGDG